MNNGAITSVVSPREGVAVLECRGDHDVTTRGQTARLLMQLVGENDLVVIDVSRATFVDSTFIHGIVKADRRAKQAGKRVRIQLGTSSIVERALTMSGVLGYVEHVRSREDAVR